MQKTVQGSFTGTSGYEGPGKPYFRMLMNIGGVQICGEEVIFHVPAALKTV